VYYIRGLTEPYCREIQGIPQTSNINFLLLWNLVLHILASNRSCGTPIQRPPVIVKAFEISVIPQQNNKKLLFLGAVALVDRRNVLDVSLPELEKTQCKMAFRGLQNSCAS